MLFKRFRMSIVSQVLLALALGIFCGLFFGEDASRLGIIGDIYIGLLQMTVLPYLIIALVGGVGRLDPAWAARLGTRGAVLLILLWAVSFLVVLAVPLSYPDWSASSAFSSIHEPAGSQTDLLGLFIPSNVFRSLSDNLVPGVVFFCVVLGIAIMSVDQKDTIITILDGLLAAVSKMTNLAVRMSPFGVFAISADAAGSIDVEYLGHIKVHFMTFGLAWALMHFAVFPVILAAATPVSYWKLLSATQVAVVTAFATNSTLVVLPLMIASCKEILEESGCNDDETNASVDVLIPTSYSIPNAGALLNLGFVLFAAWSVGNSLEGTQNIAFVVSGGLFAVAGMVIAIPKLLDLFQLPADFFQLYLLAGIITSRFSTAVGVVFGVVLSLLVAFSIVGKLNVRRLLVTSAVSVLVSILTLKAFGYVVSGITQEPFEGENGYRTARPFLDPVEHKLSEMPDPLGDRDLGRSRLDVIKERGTLRVGYRANALPYSFINDRGEVAGFDIELINALARDLGVTLEFVVINANTSGDVVESGRLDIVAGGIAITTERALRAAYSDSYFIEDVGFVVPDYRRNQFVSMNNLRAFEALTLAVPQRYNPPILRKLLPNATIVPVESARDFVIGNHPEADALLFGAQTAFAWTLSYPDFSVTIPRGLEMRVPLAFLLPADAPRLVSFVNTWLALNKEHGLVKLAHDHWILGKGLAEDKPRWSIIRDVLGWVD